MEFNDLVEVCGQALIIFFTFKLVTYLLGFNRFLNHISDTNDQIKQYLASIIHPVKSERHGDTIYFFDEDNDTFIAQGRNDAELAEALKARWKDHIFILGEKYVMAGPDFKMLEITDPEYVGKMLADRVINKTDV
jgi:predicted PhzF superfamily epimerase YddE/YHI9